VLVWCSRQARQELLRQVSLIQAESQAGALIQQDRQLIQCSSEALLMKLKGASTGAIRSAGKT